MVMVVLGMAMSVQAQLRHQFSAYAGGGRSTPDYETSTGVASSGFGGMLGAGYTLFFSNRWGVTTGLEAALFNGKYDLLAFSDSYPSHDGEENFEFNYALTSYRETQRAVLLNIPIMLRFEHGRFYAAVGAKAGIRLHAAYRNNTDELKAWGYYSQYDLTLYDPASAGFGTFNNLRNEGNVALKTAFFASAEAGVKWGRLYAGLYLDYGLNDLNDLNKAPELRFIPYELPEPAAYKPQSVLAATADRLGLMAVGIKIGFVIK